MTDLATAVTGWAEDRPDVIGTMFARGFRVLSDRAGIAVWATVDLFERVERELGRPPTVPHAEVRQYLRTVLNAGTTDG